MSLVVFYVLFISLGYCEVPIIADEERVEFDKNDAEAHPVKIISQVDAELLAYSSLKERNIDIIKYDMLSMEEIQWSDTKVWFIIFQLKKEFCIDPKKSGGEIFVSIDQNTSEVMVTYAGSEDSYQG